MHWYLLSSCPGLCLFLNAVCLWLWDSPSYPIISWIIISEWWWYGGWKGQSWGVEVMEGIFSPSFRQADLFLSAILSFPNYSRRNLLFACMLTYIYISPEKVVLLYWWDRCSVFKIWIQLAVGEELVSRTGVPFSWQILVSWTLGWFS